MFKNLMDWIEYRLPIMRVANMHAIQYPAPRNMNFWYVFGFLATIVLVNQLVTGIWLTMSFEPSAERAFASVEYIMRDVEYGWILRYMHSTGASAFFIVVYLHMFRGMIYGSYQKPRELLWLFGMFIYLALMAEAFMGYVLPWGQMSYWGVRLVIQTGLLRQITRISCPGSILLISASTSAPAARAFTLGFQDPMKGIAAPATPTPPTTDVATVKKRRRLLSCGWFSVTDESFASNDTLLIQ